VKVTLFVIRRELDLRRHADELPIVGQRAAFRGGVPNFRLADNPGVIELVAANKVSLAYSTLLLQPSPRGCHEGAGVRVARLVTKPTNADPDLHETYFMKRTSSNELRLCRARHCSTGSFERRTNSTCRSRFTRPVS
jgi:hypothetical protein